MASGKREYTLSIWLFSLGYFLFYIPYSGLTKAITDGSLHGGRRPSGFELLPSTVIATAVVMLAFVTAMGWWRLTRRRTVFGISVPFPQRRSVISGIAFAIIISTTTLAYTFSGISIIFALLLMRGGVLLLAPLVDFFCRRKVRWFSWTGLVLSLLALAVAFSDVKNYKMTLVAAVNLAAYLTGYIFRLPTMTHTAKTRDLKDTCAYFAEEQLVAMPVLVLLPALFALIDRGAIMRDLRLGFAGLLGRSDFLLVGVLIGFFYAGLGIFGTFIYLDRRENTFCVPLNRCFSLLSGLVATSVLASLTHLAGVSPRQLAAAGLIVTALLVMSPLHHLPLYVKQLREAIAERRLVIVDVARRDRVELPDAQPPAAATFITLNFEAVREVLRKRPRQPGEQ